MIWEFAEIIAEINDDVAAYFRALGFTVTWDLSRDGLRWYEIYDGDTLLVQIDFGAALADLITDLPLLAAGKPSTCASNWTVRGESNGLARVVERMTKVA